MQEIEYEDGGTASRKKKMRRTDRPKKRIGKTDSVKSSSSVRTSDSVNRSEEEIDEDGPREETRTEVLALSLD